MGQCRVIKGDLLKMETDTVGKRKGIVLSCEICFKNLSLCTLFCSEGEKISS